MVEFNLDDKKSITINSNIEENPILKEVLHLFSFMIAKGFTVQALHEYQDEQGHALFWKIRLKNFFTGEKWIRPIHFQSGKYVFGEPYFEHTKPLYHLKEILNPLNRDKTIWIVEGEYCADQLSNLGLLATTSGSAESALSVEWTPLRDRKIIIWPDNDEAGKRYARLVSDLLVTQNCSIQHIDIEQLKLPPKGDCVDWLSLNPVATAEDIQRLPLLSSINSEVENNKNSNKDQNIHRENTSFSMDSIEPFFCLDEKGVFYHTEDKTLWICSPLEVSALVRDHSSENWGRLLTFHDADGTFHQWAMPMEMLKGGGEELRGELLRLGLELASHHKARHLLAEYITTSKPKLRARCVNRTGWYENVFVLPELTIGKTKTCEKVIYQSEIHAHDYKQSGTLQEWQDHISKYCINNSRLVFAVSCAFAALLLKITGSESGGIHFVGESSTGKTTALKVAASVFGASDYLSRWRATTNGLEALASLRSDTLLILDELSQIDPKEAGEVAYMLANGMGKVRASKNGYSRARHEWRLLFLSAGEINLEQHLRECGKKIKAGQEVRLVDVPVDANCNHGIFEDLHGFDSGANLTKVLVENTQRYYGTPLIQFLEKITSHLEYHPEEIIKKIQNNSKQFMDDNLPIYASGQVHRVCERFALIATAGKLATDYGITQWPEDESHKASTKCFQAWLEQRGSICNQESTAILSQVKSFFELHGDARFPEKIGNRPIHPHHQTPHRAGYKELKEGTYLYYVLPETFSKEICAGFNYKQVCKILIEAGWIMTGKNDLPHRREYLPGLGQTRCYVFTSNIWDT